MVISIGKLAIHIHVWSYLGIWGVLNFWTRFTWNIFNSCTGLRDWVDCMHTFATTFQRLHMPWSDSHPFRGQFAGNPWVFTKSHQFLPPNNPTMCRFLGGAGLWSIEICHGVGGSPASPGKFSLLRETMRAMGTMGSGLLNSNGLTGMMGMMGNGKGQQISKKLNLSEWIIDNY